MVESKKSTTKKSTTKKPAAKKAEKSKKADDKPIKEIPKATKTVKTEPKAAKSSTQAVIIAILSTLIVCIIVAFGVLMATGVIKFNDGNELKQDGINGQIAQSDPNGKTSSDKIVTNPNQRVRVNGELVTVKDLEFYLPDDFEAGGKNSDGAYTYNLVDDDGWAQVLVFAEKSNLTPEKYLMKVSPYLEITDKSYVMNGTNWVVGENGNSLAYATELDGIIYAVYYNVKLDSDDTAEAMQMIPKTLYMKKIYAE